MHVARVPALQTPNHAVSAEEGLRTSDYTKALAQRAQDPLRFSPTYYLFLNE